MLASNPTSAPTDTVRPIVASTGVEEKASVAKPMKVDAAASSTDTLARWR